MSAACSYPPRRKGGTGRGATKPAAIIKAGTVVAALGLATVPAVWADEGKVQGSTRVAAVDGTADASPYRLGMPLPRIDLDVDLKVLLAQHRSSTTQNDATTAEDTILVAIALSVPWSVDEDIAKQYGLELLDRTELLELDLRIVQFRVAGNRAVAPLLSELRNDQRIRRAQQNAQYSVPSQSDPAPGVSRLNGPPAEAPPSVPDRKSPKVAKVAQKSPDQAEPLRGVRTGRSPKGHGQAANENALQPVRPDHVGDVLSGGL
jgi:hypothetical protein